MSDYLVPDSVEPVVGWRGWILRDDRLHSPGYQTIWPLREPLEAICKLNYINYISMTSTATVVQPGQAVQFVTTQGSIVYVQPSIQPQPPPSIHEAPDQNCNCGIHLAKDIRLAIGNCPFQLLNVVYGLVYGWGKVIEGEHGYRVQYAYPKELYAAETDIEALIGYGVPVQHYIEIPDLMSVIYLPIAGSYHAGPAIKSTSIVLAVGSSQTKLATPRKTTAVASLANLSAAFLNFGLFAAIGYWFNACVATISSVVAAFLLSKAYRMRIPDSWS
jgi:hypothetical protein